MPLYEDILMAAAKEAAEAATDAHGAGYEPAAEIAYDFIREIWLEVDEPAAAFLPEEMPTEFEAAYEAALRP